MVVDASSLIARPLRAPRDIARLRAAIACALHASMPDSPISYAVTAATNKVIPQGKQWRRWRQCSHELNYNSTNLHAIGAEVPGADMSLEQWNNAQDVWTIPVWWDSKQE